MLFFHNVFQVYSPPSSLLYGDNGDDEAGGGEGRASTSPSPSHSASSSDHSDGSDGEAPRDADRKPEGDTRDTPVKKSVSFVILFKSLYGT